MVAYLRLMASRLRLRSRWFRARSWPILLAVTWLARINDFSHFELQVIASVELGGHMQLFEE
jgi:hypothetical protein